MKRELYTNKYRLFFKYLSASLSLCLILILTGCNEIQSPKPEPFIGENVPLPQQEFRWSNGKLPKSFDPARAAASPETDIVRAIYEGLTDVEAKTLKPVPAIATKWIASEDNKVWTFQLREDAKWTNGELVTAEDFVRSWKRLTELGNKVQQRNLLKNIVGMDSEDVLPVFANEEIDTSQKEEEPENNSLLQKLQLENNSNTAEASTQNPNTEAEKSGSSNLEAEKNSKKVEPKPKKMPKFGVEAISKFVLKVTLIHADEDFPVLVAHPIFRPIYGDGKDFEKSELSGNIVTNGAFRLSAVAKDGISLERDANYWNKDQVKLEKVKFVPTENAEHALAEYRAGKIDVITNANFQPLALKLLRPFKDEFHQTTHGALNFYQFNLNEKPFDDFRIREALAISIERERLTADDMDGTTEPALSFLPFEEEKSKKLEENIEKAQTLLSEAGFAGGENFPTIRLIVNRNNVQQRIARSVAKMWLKNLNIKTEVLVKEQAELETSMQTGDFNLIRRGVVLPTNNETSSMLAIFEGKKIAAEKEVKKDVSENKVTAENQILTDEKAESNLNFTETEKASEPTVNPQLNNEHLAENSLILTEDQALEQLPAIPLYFPTSYSLVKPYIHGFDLNAFDALSLKNVEIDSNWQPANGKTISNVKN